MKISLNEVIEAIEDAGEETRYFYVIPEEKIIAAEECEDYDDYDLIALPDKSERDDYRTMERFIKTVEDETAAEWLTNAIKGRGAFRRFRGTLERFHLTSEWYDYRDRSIRVLAMRWCEDNGIEYESSYALDKEDIYDDDEWLEEEEEPVIITPVIKKEKPDYRIVAITKRNSPSLTLLAADCTDELSKAQNDPDEAADRISSYLNADHRITAVSDRGKFLGYCVLDLTYDRPYIQEIFVRREERRKGLGTMLVNDAQKSAYELKDSALSFKVDPENRNMIAFLAALGYSFVRYYEITQEE